VSLCIRSLRNGANKTDGQQAEKANRVKLTIGLKIFLSGFHGEKGPISIPEDIGSCK
jgi:hypothetical protein